MKAAISPVRGLYTDVIDIRRRVFMEVARSVLNTDFHQLEAMKDEIARIPYRVIRGEDPTYRCCVARERAIITERVRLAFGLPLWEGALQGPVSIGLETVLKPERVRSGDLIQVIGEACEKCPTKSFLVTNNCRSCIAHPCTLVCPARAFDRSEDGRPRINNDRCIRCGLCEKACPFHAITQVDRPCAAACGVNAIGSDSAGRARIDNTKCVQCGMCLVACPFGAIADQGEFVQMLIALTQPTPMFAIVAPAFVGQFGPLITPGQILEGIRRIGFSGVFEVAWGADIATREESEEWYQKVIRNGRPFLGTSCCPAWVDMARREFPQFAADISHSYTPMAATGRKVKELFPDSRVTFIGPCTAKKAESLRPELADFIDFVITFEELAAILVAANISLDDIEDHPASWSVSGSGRNYAVCGGVAEALKTRIRQTHPEADIRIDTADTLAECRKMIIQTISGVSRANLIEGMACPGGCVGGAGIIAPIRKTTAEIARFVRDSPFFPAPDSSE
jgi:[FeFe] hydrogenase (group B1/B3)